MSVWPPGAKRHDEADRLACDWKLLACAPAASNRMRKRDRNPAHQWFSPLRYPNKRSADMAELYLVRHAKASFGTDDYDRVTDLGTARRAGWANTSQSADGVRPRAHGTCAGIARRCRESPTACRGTPAAEIEAGLDEYSAESLSLRTPGRTTSAIHRGMPTGASTSACCGKSLRVGGRRARSRRHLRFADFAFRRARGARIGSPDPGPRGFFVSARGGRSRRCSAR
jgi:hypothetical protein